MPRFAAHLDWSRSPWGAITDWPVQLRTTWQLVVESPLPMCLMIGPDLAMLYNDAFAPLLGSRHPMAFGEKASVAVPEAWQADSVGTLFEATISRGEAFLQESADLLSVTGAAEQDEHLGYYLRSGSPVHGDDGEVLGVLHVVVETTAVAERARAVARLATSLAVAVTVDDVSKVVLRQAVTAFDAISAALCLPSGAVPPVWRMARRHRIEEMSPDEERLPLIWSELGEDLTAVVASVRGQAHARISDTGELVAVPLRAGRVGPQGDAALVVFREATPLPHDARTVLDAFMELVGQALSRAVVFDAERTTAELLQRTLLPPSLPQSDEVTIAARYQPVSEGAVAGGDFYDSFFLPDGRLAIVIGDVVGRGVMAATVMGQVRAAVRGAALTNSDPQAVMQALDQVIADLDSLWPASMPLGTVRARPGMAFGGELFVTMLYGAIQPASGEVVLASAGHPVPAVLSGRLARSKGRPRAVDVEMPVGPPLGLRGDRPPHYLHLDIGDILVAFTDGLIERRGEALAQGEQRLKAVLSNAPIGSPRSVAHHVMETMLAQAGQEDDCALLAMGRSPEGHRRTSIVVPPLPESVRAARDWARVQLSHWGVGDADQYSVITGISELITNSVLHAGTESHLTLDLDTGVLAVTVADSGNRGEPLLTGGDPMAVRGRGLSLVRAISDAFGSHRTSAGTTVWFEVVVDAEAHRTTEIQLQSAGVGALGEPGGRPNGHDEVDNG